MRWTLCLVAVSMLACGGGARYEGGEFRDGPVHFAVRPPDGWRAISVARTNDLAWAHDDAGAVLQVNGDCDPSLDIPLVALTNHLLVGFTEREIVEQILVPVDGREALRTHVVAKLDGVPRELLLHVVKKNGCVYDFALVAPPGERFAQARASYETVLQSFETR
ncbi:MAG: hypothetical protein H6721_24595 [Sandaracinus sp.]|nr:hypothetical protein [Sandaracinus sp.]